MKLITFQPAGSAGALAGWLAGQWVIAAGPAWRWALEQGWQPTSGAVEPSGDDLEALLSAVPEDLQGLSAAVGDARPTGVALRLAEGRLLAPLPRPRTIRDFYSFEAHVKTARAKRGLDVVPEWYQFPTFYFSNPNAVYGPGDAVPKPRATEQLDFELEVAAVIGYGGRDIAAAEANRQIAGYMIMNDWSARDIQRAEMKIGLGPAKGKDFATSFGPWLVTPDELAPDLRLTMVARINGREVSRGNLGDLYHSFANMVERASQDCTLYPGDIIGSGTVGTGCLLETGAAPWLAPGDVVELEVQGLGVLINTVR